MKSTTFPARPHAGNYALELLADEASTRLDRSAVRALFRIGWRDRPEATSGEWALLYLVEFCLGLLHRKSLHPGSRRFLVDRERAQ
jgi:hypothetical protein